MKSGGKTVEASAVSYGREKLCMEDPSKPIQSGCAIQLSRMVKDALANRTKPGDAESWQKSVFVHVTDRAKDMCAKMSAAAVKGDAPSAKLAMASSVFKTCVSSVFKGVLPFSINGDTAMTWAEQLKRNSIAKVKCKAFCVMRYQPKWYEFFYLEGVAIAAFGTSVSDAKVKLYLECQKVNALNGGMRLGSVENVRCDIDK